MLNKNSQAIYKLKKLNKNIHKKLQAIYKLNQ